MYDPINVKSDKSPPSSPNLRLRVDVHPLPQTLWRLITLNKLFPFSGPTNCAKHEVIYGSVSYRGCLGLITIQFMGEQRWENPNSDKVRSEKVKVKV